MISWLELFHSKWIVVVDFIAKNKGVLLIGIMVCSVFFENLFGYLRPKPIVPSFDMGIVALIVVSAISTYKLCKYLGYGVVKRLVISFINIFVLLNIFMTIGLVIQYRKKTKALIETS